MQCTQFIYELIRNDIIDTSQAILKACDYHYIMNIFQAILKACDSSQDGKIDKAEWFKFFDEC